MIKPIDDSSISNDSPDDLDFGNAKEESKMEDSGESKAEETRSFVRTHSLCCDPLEEVQCEYFAQLSGNLCFKRSVKQQVPHTRRIIFAQ